VGDDMENVYIGDSGAAGVPGVISLMIILAPDQPQPAPMPVPPTRVVDRFDRRLVQLVDQPDGQPVPIWPVVHEIVEGERPVSRAQRRQLVARLLCRLRGLLRAGSVERVDKGRVRLRQLVNPTPSPAPKPVQNAPSVPFPTVVPTPTFRGGGPYRRVFDA